VFANTSPDTFVPELNSTLADALLAPHRSYYALLHPFLSEVKALAHITGGGFVENIPRILPETLDAKILSGSWSVPPLWKLIQQKGDIAADEMYRVFNMGIGMVAIVDKSVASDLQTSIPEPTFIIGELVEGEHKTILA
jgi:phosphoribosylaminoimidazole (AIR) synthetase